MNQKPFGRPRTHNREQIAIDLIEWARKDDSINFNKFCALYPTPFPATKLLDWSKEDEDFRVAYDTAKAFLGFRREEKLNKEELHVKAYDLNATVYDLLAKAEKQEQAKFDASLRKENEKPPEKVVFEVNYNGRAEDKVQILPKTLSNEDSSSS